MIFYIQFCCISSTFAFVKQSTKFVLMILVNFANFGHFGQWQKVKLLNLKLPNELELQAVVVFTKPPMIILKAKVIFKRPHHPCNKAPSTRNVNWKEFVRHFVRSL